MEKRKADVSGDEPGVKNKKQRSVSQLSLTVVEAMDIVQTSSEAVIEAEALQQAFEFLTTGIKAGNLPSESQAALLGNLSQTLKPSSASIKQLLALEPSSLARVDTAAIQLLELLGKQLQKEAGRPLVDGLLAIAQRHIPCRPASQARTVYDQAFAALATIDVTHLRTQHVAQAIVASLDQCFDSAAHESTIDVLDELTRDPDGTSQQLLVQCGAIASLCRFICSTEPSSLPAHSGTVLGNYVNAASSQQVQQILDQVGEDVIACQLAPSLVRRALLCRPKGYDLWALKRLVEQQLLLKGACIQAGAIHAALINLKQPADKEVAELLACLVDSPEAATNLLASNGIQHIASALPAVNTEQMTALLQCLSFVVTNESSSYPATLQCLRQGVLWRLQRRCKQLETEGKEGDSDGQSASIASADFAELLCSKATAELERVALLPVTAQHAVWVGCFLAEHTADDRLKTIMLDWGVLQRLCKQLSSAAAPPRHAPSATIAPPACAVAGPPMATSSQADDCEPAMAAAGGLLALLNRLKASDHAAAAAATNSTVPGGSVLHVPIDDSAFLGAHRWREVKLLVEGREFYVFKDALLHASPAFRAMLEGGFSEQGAPEVVIPNVTVATWAVVMRYVYTGAAVVPPELAQQVLLVADQYLLNGLKGLCQEVLIAHLTTANLPEMFALAGDVSAHALQRACIVAALEHWEAGGTFSPAAATVPAAGGSRAPGLHPEQQVASMPADTLDAALAGPSGGSTAADKGAHSTPQQGDVHLEPAVTPVTEQQLPGPLSSAAKSGPSESQGAEQQLAASPSISAVGVVAPAGHPAMAQGPGDVDQQLRRQVAAVLLPLLEQLMDKVLPTGTGAAS